MLVSLRCKVLITFKIDSNSLNINHVSPQPDLTILHDTTETYEVKHAKSHLLP